jgi:hypothetical protein
LRINSGAFVGNGLPDWREAEVQGGEGLDIAPTGRRADLLGTAGEEGKLRSNRINERLHDALAMSVLLDLEFCSLLANTVSRWRARKA